MKDYTYIGTILTNKNELIPEIERRIKDVNSAYFALLPVLKNRSALIHSVFCLTTGPKPPLKQFLHIVRSRASSFK